MGRYFAQEIQKPLQDVLNLIITKCENKQQHKIELIQDQLQRCCNLFYSVLLPEESPHQIQLAQHVSRSVSNFLTNFVTKGTRSAEESQAVKILLAAIAGDLKNNADKIHEKELREFMGIVNWTKSFKSSRELREQLDSANQSGNQSHKLHTNLTL
jgi:hypothetical protein